MLVEINHQLASNQKAVYVICTKKKQSTSKEATKRVGDVLESLIKYNLHAALAIFSPTIFLIYVLKVGWLCCRKTLHCVFVYWLSTVPKKLSKQYL